MNMNCTLAALSVASLLALAACGGGSSTPTAAPQPNALAIIGTAATGAAISGGTVEAKCASGTASAQTATNGTYSLSISGGALPCVLRVTSGGTVLHSLVITPTVAGAALVANITPLTELLVANVAGAAPSSLFSTFDTTAQARVTPTAITAAISTTLASLQGTVDLTGVNPLSDTLIAANGSTAGNSQDVLLDRLNAALATSGATLARLSTAVATATPTTAAPALQQIAASATSCAALRSGTYRVINPHETVHDVAYSAYRLNINATTLTITDVEPTHQVANVPPASATLTPVTDSPCRYTFASDVGTQTALVSPAGVIVLLSPSSTGPTRTSFIIPEQTIPLRQLAGNWNYLAYQRSGSAGVLAAENGTAVVDANGAFVSGTECVGLTCSPLPTPNGQSNFTVNANGGFDTTYTTPGTSTPAPTSRAFPFLTANGALSLFMLEGAEGGFTFLTKQTARTLPTVGAVNRFWDFAVGSGSFQWAPVNNAQGGASALSESSTTVTAVDTAAQTFTRLRASDERIDSRTINSPRTGVDFRAASTSTSTNGVVNISATLFMNLPGTGLTVYTNTASNQNLFGISVNRP